MAAICWTSV